MEYLRNISFYKIDLIIYALGYGLKQEMKFKFKMLKFFGR